MVFIVTAISAVLRGGPPPGRGWGHASERFAGDTWPALPGPGQDEPGLGGTTPSSPDGIGGPRRREASWAVRWRSSRCARALFEASERRRAIRKGACLP